MILGRRKFLKTTAWATLGSLFVPRRYAEGQTFRYGPDGFRHLQPKTYDWAARVAANGDAKPNLSILRAVDKWYLGLIADGLDPDIYACSFFAPGPSYKTAFTPFYKVYGSDPWVYSLAGPPGGAIAADGVQTTGTARGIVTNVNPANVFTSSDMGISWYGGNSGVNAPDTQIGGGDGTREGYAYSNTLACYTRFQFTFTIPSMGVHDYAFFSFNRTSSTQVDAYVANSNIAFSSMGSFSGASGAVPASGNICKHDNGPSGFIYGYSSSDRNTIMCVHKGWTFAKAQKFFNRCQTLRQAFGGGYT